VSHIPQFGDVGVSAEDAPEIGPGPAGSARSDRYRPSKIWTGSISGMRISKGDDTSPVGNDRISKFQDM